jgi:hypothetical protein
MSLSLEEIRQRIEKAIKDGLSDEYMLLVKDLEQSFYIEDIAAAAVAIYAERGEPSPVRRRTLSTSAFVPLRSREADARGSHAGSHKKPAAQQAHPAGKQHQGKPRPRHGRPHVAKKPPQGDKRR